MALDFLVWLVVFFIQLGLLGITMYIVGPSTPPHITMSSSTKCALFCCLTVSGVTESWAPSAAHHTVRS